jgi:hypothetical protein
MRMKRLAASVAVALALLPAQAASADTLDLSAGVFPDDQLALLSQGSDTFAVGGGTIGVTHFAFSAHLGPNGPSGYTVIRSDNSAIGSAQGEVTCYRRNISDFAAGFGIHVKKGSGLLGSAGDLTFDAIDSGGPSGLPDFLTISRDLAPGFCSAGFLAGGPVIQGNIVVRG